jgi:hypothetical protein
LVAGQKVTISELMSSAREFMDKMKCLHAQKEDAEKEAHKLRQQLDTLKRYLFVKICHMFG